MKRLTFFLALTLITTALHAQTQVPPSVLDLTLEPTAINHNPGPEYAPENQDYAMVIGIDRTPKGRLWAAWVGGGDSPLAYFLINSSDDDGKTWSHPRIVIRPGLTPTGLNRSVIVGNLWTDPTGKLWLFYDQSLEQFEGRAGVWAITCENPDAEKPTWSEPRRIWHGMTLNKPTVLKDGTWMLPISLWDRTKMRPIFKDAYPELDDQRMAHWFASTDQGKTWTRRGGVAIPDPQFDEHMLVELKDNRLWMLARNNHGIAESFSSDQGKTWTPPTPSTIQNPSARFFLRRLQSGNLLLVKNGPIEKKTGRTHMTAFLSSDEGKTWQGGLVIDERNGVSYPDGFQAPDGKIYIVHDRERDKEREVLLAKFTEADILAKTFTTPGSEGKIIVTKGLAPKEGAHLPNGIQLPRQWPPTTMDPKSTAPMPVPYLEKQNLPKTIPINRGRELFVDDYLIEETTLTRTWHPAKKHEGNPVFKAETQHELEPSGIEGLEQAVTYLGHGGVFYNPKKKQFEMFYTASWRGGLALATSTDLINWTRPKLGLYKDNLILPPGKDFAGIDNAVWLDLSAKDPNQRYKAIIQRGANHTLHTSPNGLVWSNGIEAGKAADYCSFFYNPFRNVWVQSIKRNSPRGRARHYYEHKDFLKTAERDQSVYWTNADELDKPDPAIGDPPQLYSLNAVAYESLMLGQFYIHLGPKNEICYQEKSPKITELHLGFSRDGFHWSRPTDRTPFIAASRKDGTHDRGYIHGTNGVMLIHEDQLWFPYCAYSGIAPNGHRGMYTGASIGMATLRRDGFASLDAKDGKPGTLTTRPVAFHGRHLFVNIDAPKGELRVEILDENNTPIAPFTKENSIAIQADSTKQEVTWNGAENLDLIRGKPVKIRLHLTNGSLYSFWVSPDQSGASNGHLGSGGPAYNTLVDTSNTDLQSVPSAGHPVRPQPTPGEAATSSSSSSSSSSNSPPPSSRVHTGDALHNILGNTTPPDANHLSQQFPYGITAKTPPYLTKINHEGHKPHHKHRIQLRVFQGCPHIEISKGGRLWATWFGSNVQSERAPNHDDQFSVISTSGDDGKTWQEVFVFDPSHQLGATASDPLLWKDAEGRIRFVGQRNLFVNDQELGDKTAWEFIALDPENPYTEWSAPRLLGNKNMSIMKPLLMPDGTILRPMDDFKFIGHPTEPRIRFLNENPDGTVNFISEQADPDAVFAEQSPIIRKDGSLFSFYRAKEGQKFMGSFDGGRTWKQGGYHPMQFSINTKSVLKRLDSGRLLLIGNDVQMRDSDNGKVFFHTDANGQEIIIPKGQTRMRMTAFLSEDDGKTFPHNLLLNEQDTSYPSVTIGKDGMIYMAYDHGRGTVGKHVIYLTKITEQDILAGKIINKNSILNSIISKPGDHGGGRRPGDSI
ncbi:hypothetical protein FEM03_22920 [Phragmitibacter flavus]|uniref:Sialidase domain-containing protein n=1 Tax=Phragmitibacter flavus TaxID=2576071 RepID=A0A5R8KA04_9BACT|nr:sialidase family protein [Phragmitibacter flavus]TLD68359.1 hypothetical protein FEM03_22920 [Phragmitibacter flavus]